MIETDLVSLSEPRSNTHDPRSNAVRLRYVSLFRRRHGSLS